MTQRDLRRLERVVELYKKAEELLDMTHERVEAKPTEYIEFGGNLVSKTKIIRDMWSDARVNREWIENRLKDFKEYGTDR